MDIRTALLEATQRLVQSDASRLEAEVLLCHVLQCPRSYPYTWPEYVLSATQQKAFEALLKARQAGRPIAYLVGMKEFWSLPLQVNEATLIPRPDTEILVEQVLSHIPAETHQKVLDLGTGSGAIALAVAFERPACHIIGIDISHAALQVAQANALQLKLTNLAWINADWCAALSSCPFDLIVSNPPYIAMDDPHLQQGDVRYEPLSALAAAQQGLSALRQIISHAGQFLRPQGWLCLEHGYTQSEAVQHLLGQHGYTRINSVRDLSGHLRVTQAQKN